MHLAACLFASGNSVSFLDFLHLFRFSFSGVCRRVIRSYRVSRIARGSAKHTLIKNVAHFDTLVFACLPQGSRFPIYGSKQSKTMLQVQHIHLSYGPRLILDDVSFTVAPGEKAGLIGVNGAGKRYLLKIIAGLQSADSGTVSRSRSFGYL